MAATRKSAGSASSAGRGRPVPRPFAFHWGAGNIIEEASFTGKHTEPAIQLLEYEGDPGSYGLRFCYYSLDGRFQRSPMMLDSTESLDGLRAALKKTPKLRSLLKRLVAQ
ncbi:MAG: hypothetical protein M3P30_07375 [Chloroflexota bacterium]|nr:hypothetical protein [Chloroflexota bacterium]